MKKYVYKNSDLGKIKNWRLKYRLNSVRRLQLGTSVKNQLFLIIFGYKIGYIGYIGYPRLKNKVKSVLK